MTKRLFCPVCSAEVYEFSGVLVHLDATEELFCIQLIKEALGAMPELLTELPEVEAVARKKGWLN